MPEEHRNDTSLSSSEVDPELAEAVNQLVWFIADEFVDAYAEAVWLREMLPEPKKMKVKTAGQG